MSLLIMSCAAVGQTGLCGFCLMMVRWFSKLHCSCVCVCAGLTRRRPWLAAACLWHQEEVFRDPVRHPRAAASLWRETRSPCYTEPWPRRPAHSSRLYTAYNFSIQQTRLNFTENLLWNQVCRLTRQHFKVNMRTKLWDTSHLRGAIAFKYCIMTLPA